MSTTPPMPSSLVGARRLERVLRPVHQRRAQRHRADRPVSRRRQAARRHRVRPHPARARHRAADRQSLLRLSRLAAGEEGGPQRRHGHAVRPERAAHVHRRLRHHAADLPQDATTRCWRGRRGWPGRSSSASSCCSARSSARRSASYTPRAAMLGTLAGISIAFISMRPAFQMWEVAWISLHLVRHRPGVAGRRTCGCRSAFRAASRRSSSARSIAWVADAVRLERRDAPARGRAVVRASSACTCRIRAATCSRAWPISRRCWSPRSRSASTTSPRA